MLSKVQPGERIVTLEVTGKPWSTEQLAAELCSDQTKLLLLFAYLGVTIYWSLRVYQDGDIRLGAVTDLILKHKDRYI